MTYTPHTDDDIGQMLAAIGAGSIDELWSSIPEKVRLTRALALPDGIAESELVRKAAGLAARNEDAGRLTCLLGAGTYHHYVPPAVDQVLGRSEFYTAYTPYQPEVSQGTLQAIFEFQTMVCELTGMDVANASMYDGAEATAEAVLMAARVRPKNSGPVLLLRSVDPRYRATVRTYLAHLGRELKEVAFGGAGTVDLDGLKKDIAGSLAVVVQGPNYFGCVEDLKMIAEICHEAGALLIVVVTEALSLGMLESPGARGADIVVGEGQSLGIPMGFGGPHLGLFACRMGDARKMPGRLVGETVDKEGRRGYVLTLATREQHIRRAKATSNICTNQGLLSLAATIYLTLTGPDGFMKLAEINRARTEYLKKQVAGAGCKLVFSAPTFNEFVLDLGRDPGPILKQMKDAGFLAGVPLGRDYPELKNAILVTVTEMVSRVELDRFVNELAKVSK